MSFNFVVKYILPKQNNSADCHFKRELASFSAISSLPTFRENSEEEQISTYDRTGGNNDGFSGQYSFIRRNEDSSLVLMSVKGPGEINRIWTPTPTKDTLDIFIDDTLHPAISICYSDLFSGKFFPFIAPLCDHAAGGYYFYLHLLFQSSCKIVCMGKWLKFHQIQYRLFSVDTKVQSFSKTSVLGSKGELEKIASIWNNPSGLLSNINNYKTRLYRISTVVASGQSKEIFHVARGRQD